MPIINRDTRDTIHIGVNFVWAPPVGLDKRAGIAWQNAMLNEGAEFDQAQNDDLGISVVRHGGKHLQARVAHLPGAPLCQLLIVSSGQAYAPDAFVQEAAPIVRGFDMTWPGERQLVSCDATVRDLYDTNAQHAFQQLWETRLGQRGNSLSQLQYPVLGGGLRFVMPALQDESGHTTIEVKIESFLNDSRRLFVETQFTWARPQAGMTIAPAAIVQEIDDYIEDHVLAFINGD